MKTTLWESKLFRLGAAAAVLLTAGVLALAGITAWKYHAVVKTDGEVQLIKETELVQQTPPILGQMLTVQGEFLAPWNKTPAGATAEPGAGSQLVQEPEMMPDGFTWGARKWLLKLKIQPYRTGEIPEGKIRVSFGGSPKGPQEFELTIPSFQAEAVSTPETADLLLAGRIEEQSGKAGVWTAIGIAAAAAAIALMAYFYWKRRKEQEEKASLTPWQKAILSIEELKQGVNQGNLSPEFSIGSLTDVVRSYLEKRFQLRAEHQTTDEFLSELERTDSVLSHPHRQFLGNFLASADMIKFARVPADKNQFEQAAGRAETLVNETIPSDEGEGKSKK